MYTSIACDTRQGEVAICADTRDGAWEAEAVLGVRIV